MTEGERLIKLETNMNNIENKVDEGFKRADERSERLEKMMKSFIDKSDDQFASKWVEKAVWGFGAVAGSGIILAVISRYLIK